MDFLRFFIVLFSALVLCKIRAGANDMYGPFNIFVAKPAKRCFTGLVNTIIHWISSNSLFLCSTKDNFSLPFISPFYNHSHLLVSMRNSVYLKNCPCSAFSFHFFNRFFFFFCFCLHWQCTFPSWVQLLQSCLGLAYSLLHTLLDYISSPWHILSTYQTSSSINSWYVEPFYIWLWIQTPIHDDEFPSFPIHLFKFLLCPLYYSSSLLEWWDNPHINSLEYISSIYFRLESWLRLSDYSVLRLLFICSWQITLLSMMLKYL